MGRISLEQKDNLIWLGRYTERVYTTLKLYFLSYDEMIDRVEHDYRVFCERIDIPDIYGSKENFLQRYPFDEENPDSIYSNLLRAYNNGIVLREEIGSEALAYVQLAVYELQRARDSEAPMLEMQKLLDNLLAFWGAADDGIENEQVRNLIKFGKRVERLDLYSRLEMPRSLMKREISRLSHRIRTLNTSASDEALNRICAMIEMEQIDYNGVVREIEKLTI